ncbi:hypothetical protein L345_10729, partial [Ophiophagus hannah]
MAEIMALATPPPSGDQHLITPNPATLMTCRGTSTHPCHLFPPDLCSIGCWVHWYSLAAGAVQERDRQMWGVQEEPVPYLAEAQDWEGLSMNGLVQVLSREEPEQMVAEGSPLKLEHERVGPYPQATIQVHGVWEGLWLEPSPSCGSNECTQGSIPVPVISAANASSGVPTGSALVPPYGAKPLCLHTVRQTAPIHVKGPMLAPSVGNVSAAAVTWPAASASTLPLWKDREEEVETALLSTYPTLLPANRLYQLGELFAAGRFGALGAGPGLVRQPTHVC